MYCSFLNIINESVTPENNLSRGEGGIRTPVPTRRETTFEAAAFDHSATSPKSGANLHSLPTLKQ